MPYVVVNYWVVGYTEDESFFGLQETLQGEDSKTIVDLFEFELNHNQHGPFTQLGTDIDGTQSGGDENQTFTYYFTNTKNELGNDIVWQGKTYTAIPLKAEGFEVTGQGTLPRPTISVANLNGTFTALLALINVDSQGITLPRNTKTLEGCKVTRTRTLSKYLDAVNFRSVGTYVDSDYWIADYTYSTDNDPDPTSYFRPRDIYFIDRKSMENRDIISYEMCSAFDLAGVRLPKRQILPDEFPGIGTFSY